MQPAQAHLGDGKELAFLLDVTKAVSFTLSLEILRRAVVDNPQLCFSHPARRRFKQVSHVVMDSGSHGALPSPWLPGPPCRDLRLQKYYHLLLVGDTLPPMMMKS
jgi:hypothetical protein